MSRSINKSNKANEMQYWKHIIKSNRDKKRQKQNITKQPEPKPQNPKQRNKYLAENYFQIKSCTFRKKEANKYACITT